MVFSPTVFVNGGLPAISAEELNKFGQGIKGAHDVAEEARAWPQMTTDPDQATWQKNRIWERTDLASAWGYERYRMYTFDGKKIQFNPFSGTQVQERVGLVLDGSTPDVYDNGNFVITPFVKIPDGSGIINFNSGHILMDSNFDADIELGAATSKPIEVDRYKYLQVTWAKERDNANARGVVGLIEQKYTSGYSTWFNSDRISYETEYAAFTTRTDKLDISSVKGDFCVYVGLFNYNYALSAKLYVYKIELIA